MNSQTQKNDTEPIEISYAEIREAVKKLKTSEELDTQELKQSQYADLMAKKLQNEIQGQKDYFDLRKDWSRFLKILLGSSVLFQFSITMLIGSGFLDFTKYQLFINLVIGENFVQIIGLCYVVVNFLFPKNHK